MIVRDLEGNEYLLQATSTLDAELNGNVTLSFAILPTKTNSLFIDKITEMWEVVDEKDVTYKIIYCKKQGTGNRLRANIKAIPLFFDKFDSDRIYEEYNEHMTAHRCFSIIFAGTGFNFVLIDSFPAIQWEGFGGGDTRLKCFKDALNRYGAEFRFVGNTVYLEKQIGRDTNFMYRHKLNASNIVKEIDASALYTYAKGYGDYEDGEKSEGGGWQNAKLVREYTSPLALILGIRHAPPIKDGRIKDPETMDKKLKELVDNSLKISVSADIHDLRKQGYPLAQPELGDRVFLIDERIGLNTEVRVVEMSVTKNWKGEIIDLKLTFGSPGLLRRYQSNLRTATSQINDLIEGRSKLPFSVLDEAVQIATRALQRAQTELIFENGIIARDKNDPNRLVLFNSEGIGISDDGGATFREAITADGFVLTAGAVGRLAANHIQIGPETIYSEGDDFDPDHDYVIDGKKMRWVPDDYIIGGALYETELTLGDINIGDKFEFSFDIFDLRNTSGGVAITLDPINVTGNIFYDTNIDSGYQTHIITIEQKPSGSPSDKFYIALINWRTAELITMSDVSLKKIESGAGKQFDVWIDDKIEVTDSLLRNDLRLTSPLPTSISMNQDGITAYTTHDPNAYARLDHRGLYIRNGAIQIDGDFGAPVMQGFNDISKQVKISAAGLTTYEAGLRTSLLNGSGHHFYRQGTYIGKIGTNNWTGDTSYRGLVFDLENEADFMTWSFRRNPSDTNYTTMLAWHKTSAKTAKGFTFYDNVKFNYDVRFSSRGYIKSYTNAVEWGVRGTTHHIAQFDSGQVQFHMGSNSATHAFFPNGTKLGGSIEIDGTTYGMSPVDSPQVLIEYIEFDVELSEIGTKVYVDKTFLKATEGFAVFPNNGEVVEKGSDYFIIAGSGVADVRIVGKRAGYNRAFWGDMESLPKPEEKLQKNNMMRISALQSHKERVKENWFAEQIETRVEKVDGVNRKIIERLDVN